MVGYADLLPFLYLFLRYNAHGFSLDAYVIIMDMFAIMEGEL